MDLVTDVFGAVSYGTSPLYALITLGLLLGDRGQAIVITETRRFGREWEPLRQIQTFFMKHLGEEVNFDFFTTMADANQTMEWNLRITIKSVQRIGERSYTRLNALIEEANKELFQWYPEFDQVLYQHGGKCIVSGQFSKTNNMGDVKIHLSRYETEIYMLEI